MATKSLTIDEQKKKLEEHEKKPSQDVIRQIATRDRLERDYKEDVLEVSFNTSPETIRMLKAKRPSSTEMMTVMKLSAEAALYEGKTDKNSLKNLTDIYNQLPSLAASLSLDDKLDEEFWSNRVSFPTLQNFIMGVIRETQRGTGVDVSDMESFR